MHVVAREVAAEYRGAPPGEGRREVDGVDHDAGERAHAGVDHFLGEKVGTVG